MVSHGGVLGIYEELNRMKKKKKKKKKISQFFVDRENILRIGLCFNYYNNIHIQNLSF